MIDQKKKMDFFYVEDVCRALEFYMDSHTNKIVPKDVNLVYEKKYTLEKISDMAEERLNKKNKNLLVNKREVFHYTGSGELCKKTFPPDLFIGFEEGLSKICEAL